MYQASIPESNTCLIHIVILKYTSFVDGVGSWVAK